jgi:class 3 adenylate cyclase
MPDPPSGTVTFLPTDIEASTRLWEERPDAMRLPPTRHDALASSIVGEPGGPLVRSRGEGDSLFAAFRLAPPHGSRAQRALALYGRVRGE